MHGKNFLKNIFQPFVQADQGARSQYKGTGLGMAIVKELLGRMGGTIQIVSVENQGTTIHVVIPFEIAEEPADVQEVSELPKENLSGCRILLAEDKAQETATYLGNKLIGLKFRPLSVTCKSDPSIEAGDRITVRDEKGNEYETVVTSTTFAVLESQKVACNAASPTINGGKRLSETSKAIIANRKYADEAVEHERLEREAALEEMNRQLAESSGMYITSKKQDDGSTIYYAHDKPKLDESQIVWKMTATAIGISADGGKTYPYGLDVSGKAILDRIYVIGINAENVKVESKKVNGYFLVHKVTIDGDNLEGDWKCTAQLLEIKTG